MKLECTAKEVEVKEITGVLACDIHLLNLKLHSKVHIWSCGLRNQERIKFRGTAALAIRLRHLLLQLAEGKGQGSTYSHVENHICFSLKFRSWKKIGNKIVTKTLKAGQNITDNYMVIDESPKRSSSYFSFPFQIRFENKRY